jgi:hypothetical protein
MLFFYHELILGSQSYFITPSNNIKKRKNPLLVIDDIFIDELSKEKLL